MPIRQRILSNLTELIAAVVIAALIVVVPAPLLAQQKAAPAKPVAAAEEEESTPGSKKPGNEGIRVHGHWVIDVKDKDGKLVEHRDFQNALTDANPLLLLLTGQVVPNGISVAVEDSTFNYYNMYPASTATVNPFFAAQCTKGAPTCNPNLVVTMVGSATDSQTPNFTGLMFAGQFTPSTSLSLTNVLTQFGSCLVSPLTTAIAPVTVAPSACAAATGSTPKGSQLYFAQLTGTALTKPLSVAAGQTVSVTVTLSFT